MAASVDLNDEDELKAQIADGSTAVYFYAEWEPKCKEFLATFDELSGERGRIESRHITCGSACFRELPYLTHSFAPAVGRRL